MRQYQVSIAPYITRRKGIPPEMHVQRREAAVAEGIRADCADET